MFGFEKLVEKFKFFEMNWFFWNPLNLICTPKEPIQKSSTILNWLDLLTQPVIIERICQALTLSEVVNLRVCRNLKTISAVPRRSKIYSTAGTWQMKCIDPLNICMFQSLNIGGFTGSINWALQNLPPNLELICNLVEIGARVNPRGPLNPLILAILIRSRPIVKYLLEVGANPNEYSSLPSVKKFPIPLRLRKITRIYLSQFSKILPLEVSFALGTFHITQLLLKHGAEINRLNYNREYLLISVYEITENLKPVQTLIQLGADVNCWFPDVVNTPLTSAIEKGYFLLIQCLLKFGANPNFLGGGNFLPSELALTFNRNDIYRLLTRS